MFGEPRVIELGGATALYTISRIIAGSRGFFDECLRRSGEKEVQCATVE